MKNLKAIALAVVLAVSGAAYAAQSAQDKGEKCNMKDQSSCCCCDKGSGSSGSCCAKHEEPKKP